jgi:DNA polymerase-1
VKTEKKSKRTEKPNAGAEAGSPTSASKVVLLDGHSLAFRAFFALPETLVTSSGQVTNAVYGFTAMLIKLMADERPHGVVVCFDKGAPKFRVERYTEYKANRAETPDAFRQQLPLIREVLETLRIPIVEIEGYEADDLLATLARKARGAGDEVVIVTGDRDILQLVREGVTVIMTRRGISDVIRYDRSVVLERYGVGPEQWIDFVALKGEASDNLPGVPGIGDKTAAQLVNKYGDIEQIIAHAEDLPPKLRASIKEHANQVRVNKELGRLLDDVALEFDPGALRLSGWDQEKVRALFTSLEFRSLYERLRELNLYAAAAAAISLELKTVSDLSPGEEMACGIPVALAWDERWMALCVEPGEVRIVPFASAVNRLASFLGHPERSKVAHDAKSLYRAAFGTGVEVQGLCCDTKIAAYLLEPGAASGYALEDVTSRYLGASLEGEKAGAEQGQGSLDFSPQETRRLGRQAVAIRAAAAELEKHLQNNQLWELATDLEFPLIAVLARMEDSGILVDREYLRALDADFGQKMVSLERALRQHAGEEFNVNSQPQLQRILFEKLALPKTRRIKTGYSTDAAELEKLEGAHPIINALLEYREVAKLKTGFTEMLLTLIDPTTGRIHTTYEQTKAVTGRIASTSPNLQNIPIRGELGRQIRRAFIAPPGHVLLSADYSQIELRVLAHLSQDEAFLQAFAQGHDFHAAIGAKVYGVPVAEVTPEKRNYVKQFSYGIAYGMSAFGVSQRLGVEIEAAAQFIEAYYAQFPKVKAFLESQVEKAKSEGFTTTMFGRRRYLPELRSANYRLRAVGERMALNAPIQGSAADIIKKAMIDVDAALIGDPVAKMLLTVHDELVFEVPLDKVDRARALIEDRMTKAAELRAGLIVEIHTGKNWADAHA